MNEHTGDENIVVPAEEPHYPAILSNNFHYDEHDYAYTKREQSKLILGKWTGYYNCIHHRQKCKAKLNVNVYPDGTVNHTRTGGDHTCGVTPGGAIDLRDAVMDAVGSRAVLEPHKQARTIAQEVYKEYQEQYKHQPIQLPKLNMLEKKVYNARNQVSASWETVIRSYPLNSINPEDQVRFLKFFSMIEENGEYTYLVGWAHPALLFLFRHGTVNLFLDCTFSCVPHPFNQCMVVMVYTPAYRMYVPVFHVLMQSSTQFNYWNALHQVIIAASWEVTVSTVTCDFELPLIKAVKDHFVDVDHPSELIGCLFHWLQAIRRKLKALGMEDAEVSMVLQQVKLLTVMPEDEIISKGIPYLRQRIEGPERRPIYDEFWNSYFIPTWTVRYSLRTWNVYRFFETTGLREVLVNLTNNALEHYNGVLNNSFSGHPTMVAFVTKIRELQMATAQTLVELQAGTRTYPQRNPPNVPLLPADYANFQP